MPLKQSDQPTILRIRCKTKTLCNFKHIAVDYSNYEETLEAVMISHLKQIQLTPMNKPNVPGKYS